MPLAPGTKIGPYEITAQLGAGGMGEVYRATDTKLNRPVAIKVLPPAFAKDAERMARFTREAQTLAALNHPNIATIYGIEANAIVMELVEGNDLKGPLPLDEALSIARQIAEALEAAHEKQIVHRDLKPANIKITPSGTVKLLDFGLAKAAEPESFDISNSPTMSLAMTSAGMILGTAAYMSPEQARGKQVDRRADIWSFGIVLLETLTGRQTYKGDTIADTLASVMRDEPDLATLPATTPPAIRHLLMRCLEKDPRRRLQWIGEARLVIEDCIANPGGGTGSPAQAEGPPYLAWAVAVVLAIIAATGWYRATRPEPLRPLIRTTDELGPETLAAGLTQDGVLAISPDGSRIAVTLRGEDGKTRLYTRLLSHSKLSQLSGTENSGAPFFSPDGQWIGFHADGKLKKISVDGGSAVSICDVDAMRGASWGDDGNIVLSLGNAGGLFIVPSAGGSPSPLTKVKEGERTNRWPQVLPGSKTVLFSSYAANSIDDGNLEALSLKTGIRKILHKGGFSPRYLANSGNKGHLLYVSKNTLFAAPFDPSALALTGPAVPVVEQVANSTGTGGQFAIGLNGTLIFLAGGITRNSGKLTLFDGAGKLTPLHPTLADYRTLRFSPNGKRLAYSLASSSAGNSSDIWVKDLDRDTPSRLTFLPGTSDLPVWTADGKQIVFRSFTPTGEYDMYMIRADGSGEAHRLTTPKWPENPFSISPDGRRLAYFVANNNSPNKGLFTALLEGDSAHPKLGEPELFLPTPANEQKVNPRFSPDGRWLAYASDESRTFEIYVRPFPGPGGRWQISNAGGTVPVWSKDGRELLFRGSDGRVMSVSYTAKGDTFTAAKPRVWSEVRLRAAVGVQEFDITPDGKHIVAVLSDEAEKQKPLNHLTILLNFADELKRKAP